VTLTERMILANQYQILAALTDKEHERESYEEKVEILQNGYELHFDDPNFSDEVMTDAECKEILAILSMFEDLLFSFRKLEDKSGIKAADVVFSGFDGNYETKQMGYAQFFCERFDGGRRFQDLRKAEGFGFNSHAARLPRYRAMLGEHKAVRDGNRTVGSCDPLTNAEIQRVLTAKR
jgi:uncharacterized protein